MSVQVEAVPRAKLPVFETIMEGLETLRSNWAIIALQVLTLLSLAAALDLLPALAFGMSSFMWLQTASADAPVAIRIIVWMLRVAIMLFLSFSLMFGIARAALWEVRPSMTSLLSRGPRHMQEICASLVILFGAGMTHGLIVALPGSDWSLASWGSLIANPLRAAFVIAVAQWLLLAIPAVAINSNIFTIPRLAEGNALRLIALTLCYSVAMFGIFAPMRWLATLASGESPEAAAVSHLVDLIAAMTSLTFFSAIGAAAYRRLIAMKPNSESAASTDQV
ncbi:hypothetical protein FRZ44_46220 [Hypericibacter terrae]|uniref:Uncharacterized protein n=1 Tax=Hypericibacter terrae TaxID=2602015 RepID=A0A5J6MPP2_9PROT|nr:hypothetical protein [Hypericibacter terrae]QEX19309.1 hypothetical protein FRZ44_46220 [Hypericibacter terrae]